MQMLHKLVQSAKLTITPQTTEHDRKRTDQSTFVQYLIKHNALKDLSGNGIIAQRIFKFGIIRK